MEILFTWIGTADYDASQVDSLDRPGPVMQALKTETFDKVILIQSVMPKNEKSLDKKGNEFLVWLKSKSSCDIELMKIEISNPTDVDSIYKVIWDKSGMTYGELYLKNEEQFSKYNFELSSENYLFDSFNHYEKNSELLLKNKLPIRA